MSVPYAFENARKALAHAVEKLTDVVELGEHMSKREAESLAEIDQLLLDFIEILESPDGKATLAKAYKIAGGNTMNANDRIWFNEYGAVLTPIVGIYTHTDGEVYNLTHCDQWNESENQSVRIYEVWYYECADFMGYIVCKEHDEPISFMPKFLKRWHEVANEQKARKANALPVILYEVKK